MTRDSARAAQSTGTQALVAGLVTDLRRSIDCTTLYQRGVVPAPCAEVESRLSALLAGVDPFVQPPR